MTIVITIVIIRKNKIPVNELSFDRIYKIYWHFAMRLDISVVYRIG